MPSYLSTRAFRALSVVALSLVIPAYLFAESVGELSALSLEQLMSIKVTSVSKIPVEASKAPGNVEVITRDDLRKFGYRKISEALRRIVGFNIYSLQYDFAFVRGFSVPGDFNTRMLVLVDGHRTNDNNYLQGFIGDEFPGDIENVERIEVSKGPGSAVWGTDAMLAVVNIVTRKGLELGKAVTSFDIGSGGRQKWFAGTGDKVDDLSYTVTASYLNSDGDSHIAFPPVGGQSLVVEDVDQQFGYRFTTGLQYKDLSLNVAHGRRQTQVPYPFFGTVPSDGGTTYSDDFLSLDLSYDTQVSKENNSRLVTRFYFDRSGFDGDFIYENPENGARGVNTDKAVAKLFGFEVRYSQDLTKDLSWTVGAEAQDTYRLSIDNFFRDPPTEKSIQASEPYQLYSPYTELQYALFDNLQIVGGVRGDFYSEMDDAVTPRAAVIYNPFETSTVRLMYGQGFRAPGNSERNYADGSTLIKNLSLEPEKIDTTELSWREQFSSSVEAKLNLFYYTYTDLITQVALGDGAFQYINSEADARSKGIELTTNVRIADGLTGYAGFTYFETTQTGVRLPASPRILANGGISIPLIGDELFISPEIRYVGSSLGFSEDGNISSYIAADINVLSKPFGDKLEVSAGIHNLFNEEYFLPAGAELFDRIPQESRTYRAQVQYRFD